MKKRLPYIIITVIIFITEVLIALYVHDDIIRPYVGDVLVTALLCTLVRSIYIKPIPKLWLWVFAFSIFVEITQYFHLVDLLGIKNRIIRTIMGTHFVFMDIVCYFVGCLAFFLIEEFVRKRNKSRQ
ncbi:MAG: DUF2809 domain-containing protein [Clostridia bacterium]|nr:DUF2809 domain-containing protein [Clostridia bacterium]